MQLLHNLATAEHLACAWEHSQSCARSATGQLQCGSAGLRDAPAAPAHQAESGCQNVITVMVRHCVRSCPSMIAGGGCQHARTSGDAAGCSTRPCQQDHPQSLYHSQSHVSGRSFLLAPMQLPLQMSSGCCMPQSCSSVSQQRQCSQLLHLNAKKPHHGHIGHFVLSRSFPVAGLGAQRAGAPETSAGHNCRPGVNKEDGQNKVPVEKGGTRPYETTRSYWLQRQEALLKTLFKLLRETGTLLKLLSVMEVQLRARCGSAAACASVLPGLLGVLSPALERGDPDSVQPHKQCGSSHDVTGARKLITYAKHDTIYGRTFCSHCPRHLQPPIESTLLCTIWVASWHATESGGVGLQGIQK